MRIRCVVMIQEALWIMNRLLFIFGSRGKYFGAGVSIPLASHNIVLGNLSSQNPWISRHRENLWTKTPLRLQKTALSSLSLVKFSIRFLHLS